MSDSPAFLRISLKLLLKMSGRSSGVPARVVKTRLELCKDQQLSDEVEEAAEVLPDVLLKMARTGSLNLSDIMI